MSGKRVAWLAFAPPVLWCSDVWQISSPLDVFGLAARDTPIRPPTPPVPGSDWRGDCLDLPRAARSRSPTPSISSTALIAVTIIIFT